VDVEFAACWRDHKQLVLLSARSGQHRSMQADTGVSDVLMGIGRRRRVFLVR
jgi:hypothetical protein